MKRPFYTIGIACFVALAIAARVSWNIALVLAGLCALGFAITLLFRRGKQIGAIRAMLAAACIAFCSFAIQEKTAYLPQIQYDGSTQVLTVKVVDFTDGATPHAVVKVESGVLPRGAKIRLYTAASQPLPSRGDVIRTTMKLSAMEWQDTDEMFSFAKAEGVYLCGYPQGIWHIIGQEPLTLTEQFAAWQASASAFLQNLLPRGEGTVAAAICFGDRSALSAETTQAFRAGGVSHLLAVSGLHVSVVAFSLYAFLRKCRLPIQAATAVSLTALAAFCLFVGGSPSVVRAAVLHTVLLLGECTYRRADSRNSLGLALCLLLLIDPYTIYDLGLWLSFGATWGLIVLYPPLHQTVRERLKLHPQQKRSHRFADAIVSSLCVTIAATVPLLPLTIYVYRTASWTAPLTNLLCIYPAMLLLWSGWITLCLACIWTPLATLFIGITTVLERYILAVTHLLGQGWAVISLEQSYLPSLLLAGCLLMIIGYRLHRKRGVFRAASFTTIVCAGTILLEQWL